jgi:hypothetical protein
MQELIDFLAGYEPLFPQIVKGHPPEEVDRYERALGVPLPSVYREFMLTMGINSGLGLDGFFVIDELIDLANDKRSLLERMRYQLIPAAADLLGDCDYYVHMGRPWGKGDGEYTRSNTGGIEFTDYHASPSFRDHLFYRGFLDVRMVNLHRVRVMWYETEIQLIQSVLDRMGFRDLKLIGPTHLLYERGDCAAAAHKHWLGWELESSGEGLRRRCSVGVSLGAQTRESLDIVLETLLDNIPGETWIWGRQYLDRPE